MTVKEVLDFLNIKRSTLYKYVGQNRLTVYHKGMGKASYFKRSEVETFAKVNSEFVPSPKTDGQLLAV